MQMRTQSTICAAVFALLVVACSDSDRPSVTLLPTPGADDQPNDQPDGPPDQDNPPTTPPGMGGSAFTPADNDIVDLDAFYDEDGYAVANVIRVDIRTETVPGICTIEDQSGCTLADVIADVDNKDDFKVEIPVHFSSSDFGNDGSISNATLRQRGNSARLAPQKSFRIKLDSKDDLWRNERRLQLNKHPYDASRIKNKLSFELIRTLPYFPSLRTQFVNLWIDDGAGPEDYGLFTHVEFAGKEYLENRGLDKDDNLYKVEFFEFSEGDMNFVRVDEDGEPLDEDQFATRLGIERGDDHSKVTEMLEAVTDPDRDFDTVLDQYFNRNNVLMWISANILMHQTDSITANFYLYNPKDSDTFYFLPWDYDGTFEPEIELSDSYDNVELAKRKFYGYARGINSVFVTRYYRQPGAHQRIVQAVNEIRNTYLTDAQILELANSLNVLTEPHLTSLPDSEHGRFESRNADLFARSVQQNLDSLLTDYGVPMPPTLLEPEFAADGTLTLSWEPAFDVTRSNTISYDLQVSTSYLFEAENIIYSVTGLADAANLVQHTLDAASLPSGQLFVRLTARGSTNPQRFWQTASNYYRLADGTDQFGIQAITVP